VLGYWHVPVEQVDCATDRLAEAVDLHLAYQAPLLSITSGRGTPQWAVLRSCWGFDRSDRLIPEALWP
jgi:hypothetical protein